MGPCLFFTGYMPTDDEDPSRPPACQSRRTARSGTRRTLRRAGKRRWMSFRNVVALARPAASWSHSNRRTSIWCRPAYRGYSRCTIECLPTPPSPPVTSRRNRLRVGYPRLHHPAFQGDRTPRHRLLARPGSDAVRHALATKIRLFRAQGSSSAGMRSYFTGQIGLAASAGAGRGCCAARVAYPLAEEIGADDLARYMANRCGDGRSRSRANGELLSDFLAVLLARGGGGVIRGLAARADAGAASVMAQGRPRRRPRVRPTSDLFRPARPVPKMATRATIAKRADGLTGS